MPSSAAEQATEQQHAAIAEWPTESEASVTLGCSVKSINRYAEKGLIELRKRQRIGKKPENVCNPWDVEKLKPRAFVMPDGSDGALVRVDRTLPSTALPLAQVVPVFQAMATALETIQRETADAIARRDKLALTIREAMRLGFSRRFLETAIAAGRLKCFRDGRSTKVTREALGELAALSSTPPASS